MSPQQKVAVVTGASQGIGAALGQAYRDAGYRVVATSRSIQLSDDPDVLVVAGDISEPKLAERVIRDAIGRSGRVDTLVNNAGIFTVARFQDRRVVREMARRRCDHPAAAGAPDA